MSDPKNHHYVPETYIENFCGEDGALWLHDKWKGRSFPSRPKKVLKEHFYYAQPNQDRKTWNYGLENFFSEKIEKDWPFTVRLIQDGPKTLRSLRNLYMFLYAMRVRVPNCRKAVEYALQQQVQVVSGMIKDKEYLEGEREVIALINKTLNSNFQSMEELYDAGIINITIDPHRSLLAMADIAKGFALVVSAIQFHFIKNCTPVDFNCSDNPVVYFPHEQQPNACEPFQFLPMRPFEFIFPITKRYCLYHNSQYPIRAQQIAVTETNDSNLVGRINKFIGAFADRFLVSSKELNASELPAKNLCPRLTVHKYPEERGTFLNFQYEMGEPLQLPKWKNKFEPA